MSYYPEGELFQTAENRRLISTREGLAEAAESGVILEAKAILCDGFHDLTVQLGCMEGFIAREEAADGVIEGRVRDIAVISRVNKPVCFKVIGFAERKGSEVALLSRRAAQAECKAVYLDTLFPGDVIDGRVTYNETFGSFVDIGCGIPALLHIDSISVSRISHPSDRFRLGQRIRAVVKTVDERGRLSLSHRELLGTWEENAVLFSAGQTVCGTVRSLESYGVFVELMPNLAGLAELKEGAQAGNTVSVYIKSIIPEKMKVKLVIVDACGTAAVTPEKCLYFFEGDHIKRWRYSPECCDRVIETVFDD